MDAENFRKLTTILSLLDLYKKNLTSALLQDIPAEARQLLQAGRTLSRKCTRRGAFFRYGSINARKPDSHRVFLRLRALLGATRARPHRRAGIDSAASATRMLLFAFSNTITEELICALHRESSVRFARTCCGAVLRSFVAAVLKGSFAHAAERRKTLRRVQTLLLKRRTRLRKSLPIASEPTSHSVSLSRELQRCQCCV